MPKHKATEKTVALNKSRLAKLRRELENEKKRAKSTKTVSPFSIKKEGIQIVLISDYHTPGVGKTSLLNYLTGAAKDKIGKFTPLPEVGIYNYNQVRFQIVEMPSIMEDASKGIGNGKEILAQVRSADLICFVIDISRNYDEQIDLMLKELILSDIRINLPPPPINIEKTGSNKIQVFYLTKEAKANGNIEELTERVRELVLANGIKNAVIKIKGKITLDDVVDALIPAVVYKKVIIICTKGDLAHTSEQFKKLRKAYIDKFPIIIGSSIKKKHFPEVFGDIMLDYLKKIKVFTKNAGKIAQKPLVIDEHATVKEVALKIHRSFFELFDHAIVYRESSQQKRKKVGLDFELEDLDVVELHTI